MSINCDFEAVFFNTNSSILRLFGDYAWLLPLTVSNRAYVLGQNLTTKEELMVTHLPVIYSLVAQTVSVCLQCGRPSFDPQVGKIPWRRKWQPTPILLLRKFHGWRSLVGCSPWGRKESDTTERLYSLTQTGAVHVCFFP